MDERTVKTENWPPRILNFEKIFKNDHHMVHHLKNLRTEVLTSYPSVSMIQTLVPDFQPNVAVDMGSNFGLFASCQGVEYGEIHAFEPCSMIADVASVIARFPDGFGNAKHGPKFYQYKLAASSESGKIIKLYGGTNEDPGSNSLKPSDDNTSGLFEPCVSIALPELFELIGHEYIDYMKIDIEGAEYPFLIDKDLSNIGVITLELHESTWEQYTATQLLDHVNKYMHVWRPTEESYIFCGSTRSSKLERKPTYAVVDSQKIEENPTMEGLEPLQSELPLHKYMGNGRWTTEYDLSKENA